MPLPIIQGVVRLAYFGTISGAGRWANIMHFQFKGGASQPSTADVNALETLVRRLYTGAAFGGGSAWLTKCSTGVVLQSWQAYVLDGASVVQGASIGTAGSLATNSLPAEVAHVLTLRTAKRGRSYRGRVYLPPVVTTQVNADGTLLATVPVGITAQADGLRSALGGPSTSPYWTWVVASYLHNSAEPITSTTMDAIADVQRNRKV